MSVHEVGGELHMTKRTCLVAVITGRTDSEDENRMPGLATWADGLYLNSTRTSRGGDSGSCGEAVS